MRYVRAAQEEEEDRRLERLLKHIAHEQEIADQVRRATAQGVVPGAHAAIASQARAHVERRHVMPCM